jgi:transcriptional regulator with XRE-family HTH domain
VSLPSKLLKLRQETGESLQGVADAVGASRAHVWEVETGRTKNPSFDLIRRLADHFKVSVAWLVGEVPDEKSDNGAAALYRTLQSLSPQNQQHIQAIIDSMRKSQSE